jgi:23S rRNA pseudouridine2605 synthase
MGTRLNKYLAQCGLGSRRKVELLITAGRIAINGKIVRQMGILVGPEDKVALDGRPAVPETAYCYLMLNKPKGYITTLHDEKNRPTVMDLIPEKYKRRGVFPIGRLDKDTSGLLLFTNDGDLAYKLTKPGYNIPKGYEVEIDRALAEEDRDRIAGGIFIHQLRIKTKPAQIVFFDESRRRVGITIREGKNRQIRYTFMNLGYKVKRLERTSYGTLFLRNIRKGSNRVLTKREAGSLKKIVSEKGVLRFN